MLRSAHSTDTWLTRLPIYWPEPKLGQISYFYQRNTHSRNTQNHSIDTLLSHPNFTEHFVEFVFRSLFCMALSLPVWSLFEINMEYFRAQSLQVHLSWPRLWLYPYPTIKCLAQYMGGERLMVWQLMYYKKYSSHLVKHSSTVLHVFFHMFLTSSNTNGLQCDIYSQDPTRQLPSTNLIETPQIEIFRLKQWIKS